MEQVNYWSYILHTSNTWEKIGNVTITLFISIRLFVRNSINSANETIQPPLVEFSWNFMLEVFLKISVDINVLLKLEINYG